MPLLQTPLSLTVRSTTFPVVLAVPFTSFAKPLPTRAPPKIKIIIKTKIINPIKIPFIFLQLIILYLWIRKKYHKIKQSTFNDLGVELAENLYPNHQSAVYTHLDGKNHVLHNHIIVNKVNLETGKKLREQKGESVQRAREMNDRLASRENWHILEPPKERQTETEKELIAKNEYSYMDDLRERINKSLQDVSVSSYKTFKERLSDNGVILSERGQTFSYAFLDANNKQRRARETRLGSDFGRETILHELENRARQNEFRAVEQREPAITPLERDTQQENQKLLALNKQLNQENQKLSSENQQLIDLLTQSNSLQDEYQNLLNALQEN